MISSSFSFARGSETDVESRKPTSPNVSTTDFVLPISSLWSVTKLLISRSSLATLSLSGLLCSSATFCAPKICFCISLWISPSAICASAI